MTAADMALLERKSVESAEWWTKKFVSRKLKQEIPTNFTLKLGWWRKITGWRLHGVESFGRPVYVLRDGTLAFTEERVYSLFGVHGDYRGKATRYPLVVRRISELSLEQRAPILNAITEDH